MTQITDPYATDYSRREPFMPEDIPLWLSQLWGGITGGVGNWAKRFQPTPEEEERMREAQARDIAEKRREMDIFLENLRSIPSRLGEVPETISKWPSDIAQWSKEHEQWREAQPPVERGTPLGMPSEALKLMGDVWQPIGKAAETVISATPLFGKDIRPLGTDIESIDPRAGGPLGELGVTKRGLANVLGDPTNLMGIGPIKGIKGAAKEAPSIFGQIAKFLEGGAARETMLKALTETKTFGQKFKPQQAEDILTYVERALAPKVAPETLRGTLGPIEEGYTRLFRGGIPSELESPEAGRWFTTNLETAEGYMRTQLGAELKYVDVPSDILPQYMHPNAHREPFYHLPKELANKAKIVAEPSVAPVAQLPVKPLMGKVSSIDIGLGERIITPKDAGSINEEITRLIKQGVPRKKAEAMVGGIGEETVVQDFDKQLEIRDKVTELGKQTKTDGETIEDVMKRWFEKSDNDSLQLIGRVARDNRNYYQGIQDILRENYPSGYIRVYRGGGKANIRALEREFTNVSSSREAAQRFEDNWGDKAAPSMDNVLIKVEDVMSIGAVEESELIVASSAIKNYLKNPIKVEEVITKVGMVAQPTVKPVGSGELRQSEHFRKVNEMLSGDLGDNPMYNQMNIADEVEKGIRFVDKTPEVEVYKIALELKETTPGILPGAVARVYEAKLIKEGNIKKFTDFENSLTNVLTWKGQDIAVWRGAVNVDNPVHFIRKVIADRMDDIGSKLPKQGFTEAPKSRVRRVVDQEAKALKGTLDLKRMKIQEAQSVIDKWICK